MEESTRPTLDEALLAVDKGLSLNDVEGRREASKPGNAGAGEPFVRRCLARSSGTTVLHREKCHQRHAGRENHGPKLVQR